MFRRCGPILPSGGLRAYHCDHRVTEEGNLVDTVGLRSAYQAVAAAARNGPFRDPGTDEWNTAQILGHLIANDRLVCAVAADLIDDGEPSFDNESAHRMTLVDAIVASVPDHECLVQQMERQAEEVCALMESMDDDIAQRRVTVSSFDDGEMRMDGPEPWCSLMNVHALLHLPAHTSQILALRLQSA